MCKHNACYHQFPELNEMIVRQFSKRGDVDKAWSMVQRSEGIKASKRLARKHADVAANCLRVSVRQLSSG